MNTLRALLILAGCTGLLSQSIAFAHEHEHEREHEHFHERGHGPRGPAVVWEGRFRDHDIGYWRGGHWAHGPHLGRSGWWWVVGGLWYFYPEPVYPYPDIYSPPVIVTSPAPEQPPVITVPSAPVQQSWYYCAPLKEYYPYVSHCPAPWTPVPAQPPQ